MTTTRRRSLLPPRWLTIVWALLLLVLVALRVADPLGDAGLTNVATGLLVIAGLLAGLVWFVFRSGHSARARYGVVALLIVGGIAFAAFFEVRGFTGAMVPVIRLRNGGGPGPLPIAGSDAAGRVDLGRTTPEDFPGFLGPGRDLHVDGVSLARDWTLEAPELLWRQPIGAGWSGFAVVNGWAATLEQRQDREIATLYDARTGELAWSTMLDEGRFDHPLGGVGPRSTPTIHDGLVYVLSVRGKLYALDGATGAPVWKLDLLAEYGISAAEEMRLVQYGRPTSPLIVDDLVVVGIGGDDERKVSVAAFDRHTGETVWEGGERQVSMASPAIATLAGRRQLLVVNENWVSGHDPADGRELWAFAWPGITSADSSVSQAVPVPPDAVFVSKGYGGGAALHRLVPAGDRFETRQLWHESRVLRTKLTNVAMRDGYVYGLSEGILECVELATGTRAWKAGRYGHGQILMVGDLLLVLTEDGDLVMVEASSEAHRELGRFEALDGHTWNNLALYGDLLLVRNAREAAAWRLPLAR